MAKIAKKAKKPIRKISIVSRDASGWHVQQIKTAAEAKHIKCKISNFLPDKPLAEQVKGLAPVVFYRASSLDLSSERASVLPYLADKVIINDTVFHYPFAPYKFFQQNTFSASNYTKQYAIPTYRARTKKSLKDIVANQTLSFPFIAKPNHGSQGIGIQLIRSESELADFMKNFNLKSYIFQNFIQNSGDWRVIVLGARPLGAIKRIAPKGTFLNNISQGASAIVETDPSILNDIYHIATKAASAMHLRFCGVDIIRDEQTGKYHILEVNTAPQWDSDSGFQAMTGVNVGKELINYALDFLDRDRKKPYRLVENYYKKHISFDFSTSFHFASRLWLWTGDNWSRDILDKAQQKYIGNTKSEIKANIDRLVADFDARKLTLSNSKKHRELYFKKYPRLPLYNQIFFKTLFSHSIYGLDIRPQVRDHFSDTELIQTFNQLINDHDAIRSLSTHAINFFYLLKFYFRDNLNISSLILVDPYELIEISRNFDAQIERGEFSETTAYKMRVYMLTHAIIGESQFYQRRVKDQGFIDIIHELEQIISQNYSNISKDNKNEFLVCAKICSQKTPLASIILDETSKSLSWAGNFIVDSNKRIDTTTGLNSLIQSEHRSVLFVLANKKFRAPRMRTRTQTVDKHVVGRLARVNILKLNIRHAIARVDTGATFSSLHCSDIREIKHKLYFKLFDKNHPSWTGNDCVASEYHSSSITSTIGGTQTRYTIDADVTVNGITKTIKLTLADRSDMMYPVLLGRDFLAGDFVVDIDRQFTPNHKGDQ